MANYARLQNDIAVEVISGSPNGKYHPDVAALFEPVPAQVKLGWVRSGADWTAPTPPNPPAPARLLQLSPPEYLLLFTPAERVAIRTKARDADEAGELIADFLSLVDDPRLTRVDLALPAVRDGHDLLVSLALISAERKAEIEQGLPI